MLPTTYFNLWEKKIGQWFHEDWGEDGRIGLERVREKFLWIFFIVLIVVLIS